jgi:uncharacterized metal-binding protein
VIIVEAHDFLEALRAPPLNITELSKLDIACLMRVLSKPEINHAILLNELNLVLENFGIQRQEGGDQEEESIKEEVEKKKQKQTKKKQIKMLIQSNES